MKAREKQIQTRNDESFIAFIESVKVESNKAVIMGWNKTKSDRPDYQIKGVLYKTVHDYSTGQILLDKQIGIGYFNAWENPRIEYDILYKRRVSPLKEYCTLYHRHIRQIYPKPNLFREIKDYLNFIVDSI